MSRLTPYTPLYDIDEPVDDRIVLVLNSEGTFDVPEDPEFTNPDDPVSPQVTTEAVGAEDYPIEDLHAFPDDPSMPPPPEPPVEPPPPPPPEEPLP